MQEAFVSIVFAVASVLLANALATPLIVLSGGLAVGARRGLLTPNREADIVGLLTLAIAQWWAYFGVAVLGGFLGLLMALLMTAVSFLVGFFFGRAYRRGGATRVGKPG